MNKNIWQNKWLVGVVIFSAVSLVITAVLRLLTPQETTVPQTELVTTNYTGDASVFNNIRFVGSPPAAVDSLPIAIVEPSQTTMEYVRTQLIDQRGLEPVAGSEGLWRSAEFELSYSEYFDRYDFYSLYIPEEIVIADTNLAIDNAQEFINEVFPNLDLVVQRENILYYDGLTELDPTDRANAVVMEAPFVYTIENIPVYLGHDQLAPLTIMINGQHEVQKVSFKPEFFSFVTTSQKLPLVDLAVAIDNINNNQASIISAGSEQGGTFSLAEIDSGELNEVRIEYRADLESGAVYPFYRFSGELITSGQQTIKAQIITPAVKTR